MKKRLLTLLVSGLLLQACGSVESESSSAPAESNQQQAKNISGINSSMTAADWRSVCSATLTKARADFAALESDTSPATMESVFGRYDAIVTDLQSIRHAWYMKSVHPDEAVRDLATECSQEYSDFDTMANMSRGFYERVAAIDTSRLSKEEQYLVVQTLKSFRQSGVDKDQATRDRIRALQQEISEIGNEFDKNIRSDVRYVSTTVDGLKGLPQDYIDAHVPDENGVIRISTDYPDIQPVMKYGDNDQLRKELRVASRSRGYPANGPILKKLISKRHELAQLLGYDNFASLSMDSKMIATPDNAQAFLASLGAALKKPVAEEKAVLLSKLQSIDPSATEVQVWQASYLANIIRQDEYALDSKEVRAYFQYDNVRDGIFKLTEDLFGVTIRPWQTETWHESVETYEIVENGAIIGRFYMDNHPRADKYKHAAHWGLRNGLTGEQIPLSGLAQNFPKGLMEHGQVETFLHEFGHLIHNMFSGTQKWHGITGMSMERDFVEAPSQMLEEWIWDYDTLKTFAQNEQGETIPKELVEKMNRARYFGNAIGTATQIFYATLSLNYYNRDPDSFELYPLMLEIGETFDPYPYVPETHFYGNFGHLNGYSSNYYTYQWSLAIATDLFSRFEGEGMRNTDVAKAYRDKVLGAAGSKPASEFVADFLGREFTPEAYIKLLQSGGAE